MRELLGVIQYTSDNRTKLGKYGATMYGSVHIDQLSERDGVGRGFGGWPGFGVGTGGFSSSGTAVFAFEFEFEGFLSSLGVAE